MTTKRELYNFIQEHKTRLRCSTKEKPMSQTGARQPRKLLGSMPREQTQAILKLLKQIFDQIPHDEFSHSSISC
jgi:hypothetical protein